MKFSGAGLPSLASVCQNTRELADDSEVWRGAYESEFPSGGDVEVRRTFWHPPECAVLLSVSRPPRVCASQDFGALPEALWRPCLLRARERRG